MIIKTKIRALFCCLFFDSQAFIVSFLHILLVSQRFVLIVILNSKIRLIMT